MGQKLNIFFTLIIFFYSSEIVKSFSSEEFTVINEKNSVGRDCLSAELYNDNNKNLINLIKKEMFRIEKNIIDKVIFESEKINKNIEQNSNKILDIESLLKKKIDDLSMKQHVIHKMLVQNNVKISALVNSTEENYINVNVNEIKRATNINSETLANIKNTTLDIFETLNRVINVSYDTSTVQNVEKICNNYTRIVQNVNNTEIVQVTTSTEMPSNKSQETEWDWSRCREETVRNDRVIYREQLHPLSAAGGGGGGGGGGRLRLAVRGDGDMYIYLSREARVDTSSGGLYFRIYIWSTSADLSVGDAGEWTTIQHVSVHTDLSSSGWTRVALDVGAGSLEVRVGDAATPLLVARDPRLDQVKYVGFSTYSNSGGHATFKFGC